MTMWMLSTCAEICAAKPLAYLESQDNARTVQYVVYVFAYAFPLVKVCTLAATGSMRQYIQEKPVENESDLSNLGRTVCVTVSHSVWEVPGVWQRDVDIDW